MSKIPTYNPLLLTKSIWILFILLSGMWAETGGVVKVEIYEVDTKIALYVDTFLLQL